jgi:hypothetical protein
MNPIGISQFLPLKLRAELGRWAAAGKKNTRVKCLASSSSVSHTCLGTHPSPHEGARSTAKDFRHNQLSGGSGLATRTAEAILLQNRGSEFYSSPHCLKVILSQHRARPCGPPPERASTHARLSVSFTVCRTRRRQQAGRHKVG